MYEVEEKTRLIEFHTVEDIKKHSDGELIPPKEGVIALCRDDKELVEYVVFRCPCNCGTILTLPVASFSTYKNGKHWKFMSYNGEVTLNPSIQIYPRKDGGCSSHFFIKNNKVEWC